MSERLRPRVSIVDFGMGNLFSVRQSCEEVGLAAEITTSPPNVMKADAVLLPGVGAFGDAMTTLNELGMVDALQQVAESSKPLVGICLGMQLLMTESCEFGYHEGLNVVPGSVVRLESGTGMVRPPKVPQVCWNRVFRAQQATHDPWKGSLLDGLPDGVSMYFSHSFYVKPNPSEVILATTRYGATEFCSALRYRNVFACQWHPERSGAAGRRVLRNLATQLYRIQAAQEGALNVYSESQSS